MSWQLNLRTVLQINEVFWRCELVLKSLVLTVLLIIAINVWFLMWKVSKNGFKIQVFTSIISTSSHEKKKANPKCLLKWQPACPWLCSFWNHAEHLIIGLSIMVGFLPEIYFSRLIDSFKEPLFSFALINDSFWKDTLQTFYAYSRPKCLPSFRSGI